MIYRALDKGIEDEGTQNKWHRNLVGYVLFTGTYLNQNINKMSRPKKVIPQNYALRFDKTIRNVSATQIGSYIWLNGMIMYDY